MDDNLDPRRDPVRERDARDRWHEIKDRDYGYAGPLVAVVLALFVGLLLFGMWDSSDQPNTQVGQNVERGTTPDTPRNPNAPN